jgi:AcrR family transcriptional regulator
MAAVENGQTEQVATSVASTRQGEDTRERLLRVAADEFAEKGLAGARVDEIARKASANKQLVYYYFGGKLGLYNEVLAHMIEESRHRIDEEAACESLAEKFRLMVAHGTEPRGVRWQRLLGWEALDGASDGIVREAERARTWQRHVASVRQAQEAGEVDAGLDPELVALALVSASILPYVLPQVTKFVTGSLPTDPGFGDRYEAFVEQLVGRLRPAA